MTSSRPSTRLRVLVVDDDPVTQVFATDVLRSRGHRVVSARNGKEAVDAFERETFDVVVMDIQMPGLDGLNATEKIRSRESRHHRKRTPIVALTGSVLERDKERCLKAGMDAYMAKPITARFYQTVESLAEQARQMQAPE